MFSQHLNLIFFTILTVIAVFTLNLYLKLWVYFEYSLHLLEPSNDNLDYDFIIVGCGTAGSLIAHRLSSDRNLRILILEAGGSGGPLLNPPSFGTMLHNTIHDWQYETEAQDNACLSMKDQKCKLKAGKIVGGSSKLNNLIHMNNYVNEIASWFDNIYNVTQINEHLSSVEDFDLPYESLSFKTNLSKAILNAASELKFHTGNFSKTNPIGFSEIFVNQNSGSRWTTSHTFLNSMSNNAKLLTHSTVSKILFDNNKAVGVLFERFGRQLKAYSKNGVVLAAGAIESPKLLLLSGVGPKKHLVDNKIKVIKDLPVGENLIDHVSTGLDLVLLENNPGIDMGSVFNPVSIYDYYINGKGPLTFSGCEVTAILDSCEFPFEESNCINDYPDLQLMVLPAGVSTDNGMVLRHSPGITDEVWDKYFSNIVLNNSISILPIVLHPKSKGSVKLNSKSPEDLPKINPNYLDDDRDIEILLRGIDLIKKLLATRPLQKLGAQLNATPFPGCEDKPFDSFDYWNCYVKHFTLTSFHPAGTCKMGYPSDESSVVDYDFKVIGMRNLFVADASIFPSMPSGNINTAVAIVASIFSEQLLK